MEYVPVVLALERLSQVDCCEFIGTEKDPVFLGVVLNLQWRDGDLSNQIFASSVDFPLSGEED